MDRCVAYLGIDKRTNLRKLVSKEAKRRVFFGIEWLVLSSCIRYLQEGTSRKEPRLGIFNVNTWNWSTNCPSLPLSIGLGQV